MYDADAANAGNAVAPAVGIWDTAPLNFKSVLLPLSFTRATHLLEPLQHLAASSEGQAPKVWCTPRRNVEIMEDKCIHKEVMIE